ncbi:MAG: DDE-type integrase/transposase/recombinase [Fischerella sp.]|nr:DDE-type integrase/transposase/recombinase [Fischerella sp.]
MKPSNSSWRFSETYVKVKGQWKYLYRAVDSKGHAIDFRLSAKSNARAAERFFRKALKARHHQTPRVINVDKIAAYLIAIDQLKKQEILPEECELQHYLEPLHKT